MVDNGSLGSKVVLTDVKRFLGVEDDSGRVVKILKLCKDGGIISNIYNVHI